MLVLSRKTQERIVIDELIEITILEIRNSRVKLGICCPAQIPIRRKEITGELRPQPERQEVGTR
jgi:carbon storage regulator CsrA